MVFAIQVGCLLAQVKSVNTQMIDNWMYWEISFNKDSVDGIKHLL